MMNKKPYSFLLFPGLFKAFSVFAVSLMVFGVSTKAQADMVIDTTRVVYFESKRDATFKVSNVNKEQPAFVQMWMDDGNPKATAEDAVSPFNLTPPVARLKPSSSQVVRMVYTEEPLPPDRESIFYFNMLELPQKSADENKLSFAVRTRIKVFFRPKAVKGDPMEFLDKVTWKIVQKDKEWVAVGTNPSPFHLSFFNLTLDENGKFEFFVDGGMLSPKGTISIPLGEVGKIKQTYKAMKVDYINDYGGVTSRVMPISFAK
jgi:P pilus assembly chaperone PapD